MNRGHFLALLERDFVDPVGVEAVVFFGLRGAAAERVAHGFGEVAYLADVDGDVWVVGAGCDCEGVPLRVGDAGHLEEEPLAGFVFHGGFFELDLHCVVGVTDDFVDFGGASGADFTVETLAEVDGAAPEFPAPAFVADAVVPEVCTGEG